MMKLKEVDTFYAIENIRLREVTRSVFAWVRRKGKFLLPPFVMTCLLTLLSMIPYTRQGYLRGTRHMGDVTSFGYLGISLIAGILLLVIEAYVIFFVFRDKEGYWEPSCQNRALSALGPMIKATLATLVKMLPLILLLILAAFMGGVLSAFLSLHGGLIMFLAILVSLPVMVFFTARFLYVIPSVLLFNERGFSAPNLSIAIYKKNKGTTLALMLMICVTSMAPSFLIMPDRFYHGESYSSLTGLIGTIIIACIASMFAVLMITFIAKDSVTPREGEIIAQESGEDNSDR